MTNILSQIDANLMVWLNGFHNTFFDGFMYLTSEKWVWVPVYVAIFVVILRKYGFTRQTALIVCLFAATITLADTTCAAYIRPLFCRPRPCQPDSGISALIHIVNDYRGGHYGMPSCHSANSFALAALTALIFRTRRLTLFIYAWAVVHTYSRIYLGVHYPGDILIGGIVGTLYTLVAYMLYCKIMKTKIMSNSNTNARRCQGNLVLATGGSIFALLLLAAATGCYQTLAEIL